ncbi:molybdenum cofactor synthesis domain protein [Candidatus Moduliflexus flocculans]|uniref:Molybdopterin molybdenumtransferase n=1 Tax=Candidatus Moduliflexus flocculans TaxID=1499966 RepID=A0A0S6VWC7_9BACT|nr:molybdenum cofactor synthesis domain protein [Candidatus Moduliflexus flocculans]
MIPVKDARERILERFLALPAERVDIFSALGRVLTEEVIAPFDIPPHDNSAMDGYAVRSADLHGASPETPVMLRVVEALPAGYVSAHTLQTGEAIRIMTGAPIPDGADAIIRVEDTQKDGERVAIFVERPPRFDLRSAGEDVRRGDVVLEKGRTLRPAEIGLLASLGRSFVSVHQRPRMAILATGDELVEVDAPLLPGKIINANSYSLAALTLECGAIPLMLDIARDTKADLEGKLAQAARADLILTSGGVSMGDFDFVKEMLQQSGSEMHFWQVCMKPGKPLAFGSIAGTPLVGLPGNPVSSMVSFEMFVRPALLKMMGHAQIFRTVVSAQLTSDYRKRDERKHFVRVVLCQQEGVNLATLTGEQGSGILSSMAKANGLAVIDESRQLVRTGETVPVMLLDSSLSMSAEREF